MNGFKTLDGTTLVLPQANIDTDQIIPARFLTTTSSDGLADFAFADWRFDQHGASKADDPFAARNGADILVAGRNFGCGSSREHAAWALRDFGFRAVLSSELADIFRSNALKNGLLAVEIPESAHAWLLQHPAAELHIDLADARIDLPSGESHHFEIDAFARHCLMHGVDQLGYLLSQQAAIQAFEAGQPIRSTP
jgi:3-isopropylmalate/(R)-2-methylmalate dehydratase small subunit